MRGLRFSPFDDDQRAALSACTGRLLDGEPEPDDLDILFLALRGRRHGEMVEETADFIAHAESGEKPPATNSVRDLFTLARFHRPELRSRSERFYDADQPGSIARILEIALRQLEREILLARTGLRSNAARIMLREISAKIYLGRNGRLGILPVDPEQRNLVHCLMGNIPQPAAFDSSRLVNEFGRALVREKILERSEMESVEDAGADIVLHAMAAMHGGRLRFRPDVWADLEVTAEPADDRGLRYNLCVVASCPLIDPAGELQTLVVPLLSSPLDVLTHCEDRLLDHPLPWDSFVLEVSEDGRLDRV